MKEIYQQMCLEGKPFKAIETLVVSVVVVQDLAAVKDVLIKQFDKFSDRGVYINHSDPLLNNIARAEFDEWKTVKAKLTPIFSPLKIKSMYHIIPQVGDKFVDFLKQKITSGDNILNMFDLCSRFAADVIGQTAFGFDCSSFKDTNERSSFDMFVRKGLGEHLRPFVDPIARKYQRFFRFINYKYHSKATTNFFSQVFAETVQHREKNNIKRDDLVAALMDLGKVSSKSETFSMSLDGIVGQVFALFTAGFETSSMAICEALYEMAKQESIQEKARLEVRNVMAKYNGEITHESLKEMTYVKQILFETLRMYPIIHSTTRYCRKQTTLPTSCGSSIVIPEGTTVLIPIVGIHYNPEYYPNPEKFFPERFAEQEIAKLPKCTFLPFGDGPRRCLGESFGIMESVFAIAYLLSQFRFSMSEKTPKELHFDTTRMYQMGLADELYLKVEML